MSRASKFKLTNNQLPGVVVDLEEGLMKPSPSYKNIGQKRTRAGFLRSKEITFFFFYFSPQVNPYSNALAKFFLRAPSIHRLPLSKRLEQATHYRNAWNRLSTCSDEGLTLETSAFQPLYGGQFTLSTPLINQIFVSTI